MSSTAASSNIKRGGSATKQIKFTNSFVQQQKQQQEKNTASKNSHNTKQSDKTNTNSQRKLTFQNARNQESNTNQVEPNVVLETTEEKQVNNCDKIVPSIDTIQENDRPILRVNLIKKSNRHPSTISPFLNRRRFLPQRDADNISRISSVTQTKEATSKDSASPATSHNNENQGSKYESASTFTNKPVELKSNDSKVEKSPSIKVQSNQDSRYEEARKSQKLVVSLVKDICQTVTRDDLDEMLKEIHSAINQVKLEHPTNHHAYPKGLKFNGNNKKGQQQDYIEKQQPRQAKTAESIAHHSDASNSSGLKEEDDEKANSWEAEVNSRQNKSRSYTKDKENLKSKHTKFRTLNLIEPNTEHSGDSRKNYHRQQQRSCRQLMDISSDEDGSRDSSRKPTSSRILERCIRMTSTHAKYISPHRKRSLEERLSRAQEAREKFLEYRANKFREILKKVEEMRAWKEEDTLNLKASVETKLQKAEAKRKEQLDKIIKKAHDEDSKVSEIQFINNLEAQNKRHDMNSRKKEFEARLQDLQDERQRRFEEKQAKEAAAEERRKTLEAERKAKLLEIQQRRKIKNQKVEQQKQVKENKRIERNRDREQKITAIKEAYHAGVQSLKFKINQKQEQSERRHEVNLRLIRQKAFELSIKRYNSFMSESRLSESNQSNSKLSVQSKKKDHVQPNDTKRLQLKPFNTKKFCNLCKETISSELALFSHLRSESHHSSINEHYGSTMLTTNEAVEIHNLRHIVDTNEPLDSDNGTSDDQQSSRASSLVNYYHSSYLSQANGGICMSENDRDSLLSIERKCRKLRHKLLVNGRCFGREWFTGKIRSHLAQLVIKQRLARNQTTNTEVTSLANTIDLSANNVICQQNKPIYLKINRITRELISLTTDQRISGGGLMPNGIVRSVNRLLAELNKQLASRKIPELLPQLLQPPYNHEKQQQEELSADQLAIATKMIEFYAIDTLFLYDIICCLVSILRRIVPNVSLTSKLPSTVASHCSTLIDPISLNSYYCHRSPILPARIYIKMIIMLQGLCMNHSDLCYIIFQSNNIISLSDILSYRLGFIIGNESPASSISGSSSAATLSAQTVERKAKVQTSNHTISSFKSRKDSKRELVHVNESNRTELASKNKLKNVSSEDCDDEDEDGATLDDVENESGTEEGDEDALRPETYRRTEEIVDDMTAGLCKLLASVTETILNWPLILLNEIDKAAFDQRRDDFISYMVSVGIVDTESVIMSHIHQRQHHQQKQTTSGSINGLGLCGANLGTNAGSNQQPASENIKCTTDLSSPASVSCVGAALGAGGIPKEAALSDGINSNLSNLNPSAPASLNQRVGTAVSQANNNASTNVASSSSSASTSSAVAANNKIINFTTSCIQFVTSLVKLVTAKLPDDAAVGECAAPSSEANLESSSSGARPAQTFAWQKDQTQLLATLKMTQLSGVLTLVYDMLVQSFNSLTEAQPPQQPTPTSTNMALQNSANNNNNNNNSQYQAQSSPAQLGLALHSLKLINYVAYIDIKLVQATLAEDEMLPLQLRHVCSYLINHLVQSAQQKQLQQKHQHQLESAANHQLHQSQQGSLENELSLRSELLNEIILLLGQFAYLNQDNQLLLKSGRRPTIIEQLANLPFDYFSRAHLKQVLMPTLISCAYLNDEICSLVCQELSLSMLSAFIEDQLLSAQVGSKRQTNEHSQNVNSLCAADLTNTKLASNRWRFERRFAKSKWLSAKKYFESQQAKMSQLE